ncbi:MAG: hypothetical protein ACLQEQ_05675 [Nitrososphaerales archaeon]
MSYYDSQSRRWFASRADAESEHLSDSLWKSEAFKARLAGFIDGRIRVSDESLADPARKKSRADGRRLVDAAMNPTRTRLQADPVFREIAEAAAKHPKAPAEFSAKVRKTLKELDGQ